MGKKQKNSLISLIVFTLLINVVLPVSAFEQLSTNQEISNEHENEEIIEEKIIDSENYSDVDNLNQKELVVEDDEIIENEILQDLDTTDTKSTTVIRFGQPYSFTASSTGEKTFRFVVNKPGRINIEYTITSITSGNYQRDISLYSYPREMYIYNDSNFLSNTQKLSFYLEAGTYNCNFAIKNSRINFMANYEDLDINEIENNDYSSKAQVLKMNDEVSGLLSRNDPKDWYKFYVPESGLIKLDFLSSLDNKWLNFYVYNANDLDNSIDEWRDYYQGTLNEPKRYTRDLYLSKGTYYILINSNSNTANFGKYKLKLPFTSAKSNEKETNSTTNNYSKDAELLNLNYSLNGMLGAGDDKDWYKFTIPKDMTLQVDGKLYCSNYLYLTFYSDPANPYIKSESFRNANANWNEPKAISFNISLKKGTYYLKVHGNDGKYSISLNTKSFIDTDGHWAEKQIEEFAIKGYIDTSKSKFNPNDSITRAEFVKLVNKNFGFTKKGTVKYSDIKSTDWFYNEIAIAIGHGYIDANQAKFRPNEPITREEVAAIITTIKKNKDSNLDKIKKYKDYYKISEWAKNSVEGAVEAGYMGVNSVYFNPKQNITRAETIVTLSRI